MTTARLILNVDGMTCASCEQHVRRALERVDGVTRAIVRVSDARAVVDGDPARATPEVLAAAVREAGYGASLADEGAPTPGSGCACGTAG